MQEEGLTISVDEIVSPKLRSGHAVAADMDCGCTDALVSVGPAGSGGTGSFVSSSGLILTNHHVALDAIRRASTSAQDYLKEGFVARSRAEELVALDYEVWITVGAEDVSERVCPAAWDLRSWPNIVGRAR